MATDLNEAKPGSFNPETRQGAVDGVLGLQAGTSMRWDPPKCDGLDQLKEAAGR